MEVGASVTGSGPRDFPTVSSGKAGRAELDALRHYCTERSMSRPPELGKWRPGRAAWTYSCVSPETESQPRDGGPG